MRHVTSTKQFLNRGALDSIFEKADDFKKLNRFRPDDRSLQGCQVITLFYEPSTRTRVSFEMAALKLGADVISTENAKDFTSAFKGETLEDSIRVLDQYEPFAIIMRHPDEGASLRAVESLPKESKTAIINAGDGKGEHPTQAVLDIYTIHRELGTVDGKEIALVGDLHHGRTVHSLAHLLALYDGVTVHLVAPEPLQIPKEYEEYLLRRKVVVNRVSSLNELPRTVDVIYMTRLQEERFEKDNRDLYDLLLSLKSSYRLNPELVKHLKQSARILHPLPRKGIIPGECELPMELDKDPRSAYFRQAGNGLYVRMALLKMIAEEGLFMSR